MRFFLWIVNSYHEWMNDWMEYGTRQVLFYLFYFCLHEKTLLLMHLCDALKMLWIWILFCGKMGFSLECANWCEFGGLSERLFEEILQFFTPSNPNSRQKSKLFTHFRLFLNKSLHSELKIALEIETETNWMKFSQILTLQSPNVFYEKPLN